MTPTPSSWAVSDDLDALYSSPALSVPGGSLQRQESNELLQSLLPELFSWADSLSALPTSESLSSPASILSEDSALLPHTRGEHIVGEGPAPHLNALSAPTHALCGPAHRTGPSACTSWSFLPPFGQAADRGLVGTFEWDIEQTGPPHVQDLSGMAALSFLSCSNSGSNRDPG